MKSRSLAVHSSCYPTFRASIHSCALSAFSLGHMLETATLHAFILATVMSSSYVDNMSWTEPGSRDGSAQSFDLTSVISWSTWEVELRTIFNTLFTVPPLKDLTSVSINLLGSMSRIIELPIKTVFLGCTLFWRCINSHFSLLQSVVSFEICSRSDRLSSSDFSYCVSLKRESSTSCSFDLLSLETVFINNVIFVEIVLIWLCIIRQVGHVNTRGGSRSILQHVVWNCP